MSDLERIVRLIAGGLIASIAVSGCAHATPCEDLVRAREAIMQASGGEASADATDALDRARRALFEAEQAYADGADLETARDLAYVARRRIEAAEAQMRIAVEGRRRDETLARTRADLARVARARAATAEAQRLAVERSTRDAADRAAAAALMEQVRVVRVQLAGVAGSAEDSRGLVVTVPGPVFYQGNHNRFHHSARARLDQVARILGGIDAQLFVAMAIEPSAGGETPDQLAGSRAETIRRYLIERGLPAERITASAPGDNATSGATSDRELRTERGVQIIVRTDAWAYDHNASADAVAEAGGTAR